MSLTSLVYPYGVRSYYSHKMGFLRYAANAASLSHPILVTFAFGSLDMSLRDICFNPYNYCKLLRLMNRTKYKLPILLQYLCYKLKKVSDIILLTATRFPVYLLPVPAKKRISLCFPNDWGNTRDAIFFEGMDSS